MKLLSDNDWKALSAALQQHEELVFVRTLGAVSVEVRTAPASDIWPVPMLVTARMDSPRKTQQQHFESTKDARAALEKWKP